MDLVGGELCLDFVNTGSARERGPFRERLRTYEDLVEWGERTGALTIEEGTRLRASARRDASGAGRALEEARGLRESLYRIFRAHADRVTAAAADLDRVSAAAARASAAQRLVATADGFDVTWPITDAQERAWWPAATSAMALLLSPDLGRVKECASDNCNWLFLDASKNRSRRWCEMKDCGNRAKARRHYARRRKSG